MLAAALMSAWYSVTQHSSFVQRNAACDDRDPRWPQAWHVCEVYAGSTFRTGIPASRALSSIRPVRRANAQLWSRRLIHFP